MPNDEAVDSTAPDERRAILIDLVRVALELADTIGEADAATGLDRALVSLTQTQPIARR